MMPRRPTTEPRLTRRQHEQTDDCDRERSFRELDLEGERGQRGRDSHQRHCRCSGVNQLRENAGDQGEHEDPAGLAAVRHQYGDQDRHRKLPWPSRTTGQRPQQEHHDQHPKPAGQPEIAQIDTAGGFQESPGPYVNTWSAPYWMPRSRISCRPIIQEASGSRFGHTAKTGRPTWSNTATSSARTHTTCREGSTSVEVGSTIPRAPLTGRTLDGAQGCRGTLTPQASAKPCPGPTCDRSTGSR